MAADGPDGRVPPVNTGPATGCGPACPDARTAVRKRPAARPQTVRRPVSAVTGPGSGRARRAHPAVLACQFAGRPQELAAGARARDLGRGTWHD